MERDGLSERLHCEEKRANDLAAHVARLEAESTQSLRVKDDAGCILAAERPIEQPSNQNWMRPSDKQT